MLPAAWPQSTDTAKSGCRMQDAGCLQRRSWRAAASYPEHNFTTNPKYLPATTAPPSYSATLDNRAPCPGPRRGAGRGELWMEQGMAMFTSPEDHHCLSAPGPVLPHPLEVRHNLQETQRPSFSKVAPSGGSRAGTSPVWRFRSTGYVSAAARLDRMGETGVFPCWDWIMYCTLCSTTLGGARRVHATRAGRGGRAGAARAARSAKFAVLLPSHTRLQLLRTRLHDVNQPAEWSAVPQAGGDDSCPCTVVHGLLVIRRIANCRIINICNKRHLQFRLIDYCWW